MSKLTDDELTILMIADKGEPMLAIGRWEQPVKSLVAKGYLHDTGTSHHITSAGRKAAAAEGDPDDALAHRMIGIHNKRIQVRSVAQPLIESAAASLATAARETSKITGDTPQHAAREWSQEVLRLALEKLDA